MDSADGPPAAPPARATSARRRSLRSSRHRPGTAVLARGRQTAESILDAATAILIEEGPARLTTRRVAARAGIRPGNLQYYYPAKHDVLRAVLERYLDRALHAVETRVAAAGGSPESRLQSALTALLADHESSTSCRFFWELWALAARDSTVADAMSVFYERYWRRVVQMLLDVQPALRRPRAERRAALFIAMLEGLTLFRSRRDPRVLPLPDLEAELRTIVEILVMKVS